MSKGEVAYQTHHTSQSTIMYRGETSQEKPELVKTYQDYYNMLLAYETCLNKPFVMPVSACVDVWTKKQIMKFEMGKHPMEVTEQDWINYFRGSENLIVGICRR